LVKVINMSKKRSKRKRKIKAACITAGLVLFYATPFTGMAALEPERIKSAHGQVIV
jgi:hypothetical protein